MPRKLEKKSAVTDRVGSTYSKALFPLEIKQLEEDKGTFEGYLSTYDVDLVGDVVEPGAFKKSLNDAYQAKETRQNPFLLPILWQHDPTQPVGGFTDMQEDSQGLYVKGWLDLDTDIGRRAYSGLKMGYLGGLSIGYRVIRDRVEKGVRHLLELALIEGSVVTFPANPQATVEPQNVKAGRVLSKNTLETIKAAIDQMQTSLDKLQDLVDSVETGPLEADDDDTPQKAGPSPEGNKGTQKADPELEAMRLTSILADMQLTTIKMK